MGCNIKEHLQNIIQRSIQIKNLSSILGTVPGSTFDKIYLLISQHQAIYHTIKSCDSIISIKPQADIYWYYFYIGYFYIL